MELLEKCMYFQSLLFLLFPGIVARAEEDRNVTLVFRWIFYPEYFFCISRPLFEHAFIQTYSIMKNSSICANIFVQKFRLRRIIIILDFSWSVASRKRMVEVCCNVCWFNYCIHRWFLEVKPSRTTSWNAWIYHPTLSSCMSYNSSIVFTYFPVWTNEKKVSRRKWTTQSLPSKETTCKWNSDWTCCT